MNRTRLGNNRVINRMESEPPFLPSASLRTDATNAEETERRHAPEGRTARGPFGRKKRAERGVAGWRRARGREASIPGNGRAAK